MDGEINEEGEYEYDERDWEEEENGEKAEDGEEVDGEGEREVVAPSSLSDYYRPFILPIFGR